MDEARRRLERSTDMEPEEAARLLRALRIEGDLSDSDVALLSFLDHPGARLLVEETPPLEIEPWLAELAERWSRETLILVGVALAPVVCEGEHLDGRSPLQPPCLCGRMRLATSASAVRQAAMDHLLRIERQKLGSQSLDADFDIEAVSPLVSAARGEGDADTLVAFALGALSINPSALTLLPGGVRADPVTSALSRAVMAAGDPSQAWSAIRRGLVTWVLSGARADTLS
jgi:hypothetical protein